jgi:transposase, IS30 family
MLPGRFPGRPEMRAAPETIYRALYVVGPDRLQSGREPLLRSRRLHRKRRRRPGERLGRFVAPMVMTTGARPRSPIAASPGTGRAT